jgi:hypothetical protein
MVWKGIGWMSSFPKGTTDEEREQMYLKRIEDYIKTMMTRYKSKHRVSLRGIGWLNRFHSFCFVRTLPIALLPRQIGLSDGLLSTNGSTTPV